MRGARRAPRIPKPYCFIGDDAAWSMLIASFFMPSCGFFIASFDMASFDIESFDIASFDIESWDIAPLC